MNDETIPLVLDQLARLIRRALAVQRIFVEWFLEHALKD